MRLISLLLFVFIVSCVPLQTTEIQSMPPAVSMTPTVSKTSIPTLENTSTPTITPKPTFTSSPTSTPQPPLVEHEWNPEVVLIMMRESLGDGGMMLGDLGPPSFILYADGSLFLTQSFVIDGNYQTRILIKRLSRNGICQHLNNLDQVGFIDYDPFDYTYIGGSPMIEGAPSMWIEVNAWQSKSSWYSGLSSYLGDDIIYYGQEGYPIIPPSLQDTYYFLTEYPIDGFEIYMPDRLAIWLLPVDETDLEFLPRAEEWNLSSLSLSRLIDKADGLPYRGDEKFVILSGDVANSVFTYLGEVVDLKVFFTEVSLDGSKKYYALVARPLLPYEAPGEFYMSTIPVPDAPKPKFKLTCYPSDGVLPIPTPPSP